MSTLLEHAQKFYELLDEVSNDEEVNGKPLRIFRGKITQIFRKLEVSQAHYSTVRKLLVETGCVTPIQKGARGSESIMVLNHAPTEASLESVNSELLSPLTQRINPAILSQRVGDFEKQLGGINVVAALKEIDNKLSELEGRLIRLEHVAPQIKSK